MLFFQFLPTLAGMANPNGPVIRSRRQRRGMTITELAEKVGCSYVHLANVEKGHNTARPELLWRIVDALGLDDISEIEIAADLDKPETATEGAAALPTAGHPPVPARAGPHGQRGLTA